MDNAIIIVAVIVGAPLATLITNHFSKPKVKADVAESFNRMALQLVTPQAERIEHLETQMASCEIRIAQVHLWAKLLVAQILELGETPISFEDALLLHGEGAES